MRALALRSLGQIPDPATQTKPDFCVSMIQSLLVNQGRLSVAERTGYMNDATASALTYSYGQGWESFPGGLCALATAAGVYGNPTRPGYYPQQYPQSTNAMQTALYVAVGGAALLALIMAAK